MNTDECICYEDKDLIKVEFSENNFSNTMFKNCNLSDVELKSVSFRNVLFQNCFGDSFKLTIESLNFVSVQDCQISIHLTDVKRKRKSKTTDKLNASSKSQTKEFITFSDTTLYDFYISQSGCNLLWISKSIFSGGEIHLSERIPSFRLENSTCHNVLFHDIEFEGTYSKSFTRVDFPVNEKSRAANLLIDGWRENFEKIHPSITATALLMDSCVIVNNDFVLTNFEKVDISGALFAENEWVQSSFFKVKFFTTYFLKEIFTSSEINDCQFYNSGIKSSVFRSRWKEVVFSGVKFSQTSFSANVFDNCIFRRCTFDGCAFDGTVFNACQFKDVTFDKSSFDGSSFFYCVFEENSILNSEMAGARIFHSILKRILVEDVSAPGICFQGNSEEDSPGFGFMSYFTIQPGTLDSLQHLEI